jgi:hypothetical protein
MTGFEILIAAAPVATVTATPAFAYSFMDEYPEVFQAMHPERDVLNGGTLTPAGRIGLELPYGTAPVLRGAMPIPHSAALRGHSMPNAIVDTNARSKRLRPRHRGAPGLRSVPQRLVPPQWMRPIQVDCCPGVVRTF